MMSHDELFQPSTRARVEALAASVEELQQGGGGGGLSLAPASVNSGIGWYTEQPIEGSQVHPLLSDAYDAGDYFHIAEDGSTVFDKAGLYSIVPWARIICDDVVNVTKLVFKTEWIRLQPDVPAGTTIWAATSGVEDRYVVNIAEGDAFTMSVQAYNGDLVARNFGIARGIVTGAYEVDIYPLLVS